jgi:uncharacterized damage-inducible protein DinB
MSKSRAELYRRWFEYEKDSHRKVLASFETVPPDRRRHAPYQKALELLGHIIAARGVWLFRFGIAKDGPESFFPTGITLDELKENLANMERDWDAYLAGLTDNDIARTFEYKSSDAGWFRSVVEDILTQLFGHSWYHRGQIATLVRAAGGEPAVTDLVYWSREPIAPPQGS